jgi:integrase
VHRQLKRGAMRAPKPTTIAQAWRAWYEGAQAGTVRSRSGDSYKPSALRTYERAMRLRVLEPLGAWRADVRRVDLQDFADRLIATGLSPSAIGVTLLPLRAIFGRAVERGELAVSPTDGLRLPSVRGRRERIASPQEAEALIAALPEPDRPLWATAMYAGLRRGELQALRWADVDLRAA